MGKKKILDERFERFGKISFTSMTKVNEFIDYLENGELTGTKCTVCNKKFFPPRIDCCFCLSQKMNWFNIDKLGKLISYTELNFAPKGFEDDVPYILGILDFGDYKVFGRIDDTIERQYIKIGMYMKIFSKFIDGGRITYVFRRSVDNKAN